MLLSRDDDEDDSDLQNNKYIRPKNLVWCSNSQIGSTPSVNWTDGIRDWLSPIDATLTDSYLWT